MGSRSIATKRLGADGDVQSRDTSETAQSGEGTDIHNARAERKKDLYWTALIITGNPDSAEQSIVDAGGLNETNHNAFHNWLVQWGHKATARVALNAVRSSIREATERYSDWTCSHRKHPGLSPAEASILRELDPYAVIQHLDVIARGVLLLHGCQRIPLSECTALMNVPHQSVLRAYCKAQHWLEKFRPWGGMTRESRVLYPLRRDLDGVPDWVSSLG